MPLRGSPACGSSVRRRRRRLNCSPCIRRCCCSIARARSVLESGQPVSTMRTCGTCHDTQYIAGHSYHAAAGSDERFALGSRTDCRAWDHSPGQLGRWNALLYRYASPPGDAKLDLGIAEWMQVYGARHVGGGPADTGYGTTQLDRARPRRRVNPVIALTRTGRSLIRRRVKRSCGTGTHRAWRR